MSKIRLFNKTPLSLTELVEKLISKGLVIHDKDQAKEHLHTIGYYCLVGYGLPFEEYDGAQRLGRYKENSSFEDLLHSYITDSKLRILMLSAIERIEVAIRSIINQTMSENYQSSHWYLDKSLFKENKDFTHRALLREIARATGKTASEGSELESRRDIFIHHYYQKYDAPEFPASWMVAEVLSLGSWSKIFKHLKLSRDRKAISRQLDLSPLTLDSWLHSLVIVRNISAHHGRLFARKLPMPPRQDKLLPLQKDNFVINHIAICYWLLKQISPESQWLAEVEKVFLECSDISYLFGIKQDIFKKICL